MGDNDGLGWVVLALASGWFWFGLGGDGDTGWDTGYLWIALYIMYR